MTALLLWLLAPAVLRAAWWLRAAIRHPDKLTFLDRPAPRMLRAHFPAQRPEGPAPSPPVPGAGLPPRARSASRGAETGARRLTLRSRILARLIPATGCHAAPPLELRRSQRTGLFVHGEDETGPMPALTSEAAAGWRAS